MSNKILYSPKEGTTGFCGLRGYPEVPPKPLDFDYSPTKWSDYREALESCKSNSLEIVNPEVLERFDANRVKFCLDFSLWSQLKPGDIFDLPIGYQFKEELQARESWHNHTGEWKTQGPFETHGNETRVVLRLVKTETKPEDLICGPGKGNENVPQPEPEESQTELWEYVLDHCEKHMINDVRLREYLTKHFTIQRRKAIE